MREIAYFMLETRAKEAPSIRLGSRALRWETPRLERFLWHGYRVSLYLFPCRLEGTKRLRWWMERIGSALEEQGTALWLTPELEAAWEDWQAPLPGGGGGIGYPAAVLAALNAAEPTENAPHILGLYVVQQIAAAHGGTAVFGQNTPHGAKAVVYLPLG